MTGGQLCTAATCKGLGVSRCEQETSAPASIKDLTISKSPIAAATCKAVQFRSSRRLVSAFLSSSFFTTLRERALMAEWRYLDPSRKVLSAEDPLSSNIP